MRLSPFLVALSLFFYKKNKHEKRIPILIFFLILIQITIFISGERTSFFLFNFTILLFIIFIQDFKKSRLILLCVYLISLIMLLSLNTPFKKRIVDLTFQQLNFDKMNQSSYIFSKQYEEHYKSAWKIFLDNKIIGIGPKNFREKCKDKKYNFSNLTCSTHPHNIPLQILSEAGIAGFLFYFLSIIVIWYFLFKSLWYKIFYKKKIINNFQISLLISLAILLWPLSPNGSFFNNWLSILFYYPVGFLLWSLKNNENMYINFKKKPFLSKLQFTK